MDPPIAVELQILSGRDGVEYAERGVNHLAADAFPGSTPMMGRVTRETGEPVTSSRHCGACGAVKYFTEAPILH